jgi:hypothetical protein
MTSEQIIQELERYRAELNGIKSRFVQSRNSISIKREDDPKYRTFIIEIIDLLNDSIGKNKYSALINQKFIEGINNFHESPSYKSVEDIISIIDSVITRLQRTPDFYKTSEPASLVAQPSTTELKPPEKVTLKWLWEYVPHTFWALLCSLIAGAFVAGAKFAETNLYKSITNPTAAATNSPVQSIKSSTVKK